MSYLEVGDRIREARKKAGINQEELAELARLNRVTVAKYESGKVEPGAQAIKRIADALDVTADALLGRQENAEERVSQTPHTEEARILAQGIDQMPKEERERALSMVKLIFTQYSDLFERSNADDT